MRVVDDEWVVGFATVVNDVVGTCIPDVDCAILGACLTQRCDDRRVIHDTIGISGLTARIVLRELHVPSRAKRAALEDGENMVLKVAACLMLAADARADPHTAAQESDRDDCEDSNQALQGSAPTEPLFGTAKLSAWSQAVLRPGKVLCMWWMQPTASDSFRDKLVSSTQ